MGRVRARGFGIVEILIALTLGLMISAGVYAVFITSQRTQETNNAMARIQENARYVQTRLVRALRMAGAAGCVGLADKRIYIISDSSSAASVLSTQAVQGVDNVAAGNTYGARVGTDVFTVSGMLGAVAHVVGNYLPNDANIKASNDRAQWHQGSVVMVSDCTMGHIFTVTNHPVPNGSNGSVTLTHARDANSTPFLNHTYGPDALLGTFESQTYYVGATGRTAVDGTPIYGLYMRSNGESHLLATGVSNLQVTYGVDTTPNDGIDNVGEYVPAGQVSDWSLVRAVRFEATLRSTQAFSAMQTSAYPLGLGSPDRRLKFLISNTVAIRNANS